MSSGKFILPLAFALLPLIGGCPHDGDGFGLLHSEVDFLAEDVIDLMTIVLQSGENAFVGDIVAPGDVLVPASLVNDFTVTYDLPADVRKNLGLGFGEAELHVVEDGVVNTDPLSFSFATTAASEVEVTYRLLYRGEATFTRRLTDVDLLVTVTARRGALGFNLVTYRIDGFVDLGATRCTVLTGFTAFGRPRDGIEEGTGDGEGIIDDPDVFDVFDYDIDYFTNVFRAEGEVGLAFFEDLFNYSEVL